MAIKLHKAGFERAEELIRNGADVECISNNWEEVKPTTDDELKYLKGHSLDEYGLWYLGVNTDAPSENKSKYVYPFGDLNVVQESALIIAHEQAKKNNLHEIANAAEALLKKIAHMKNK